MRSFLFACLFACAFSIVFASAASFAKAQEAPPQPVVSVSLVAETTAIAAGDRLTVAVRQQIPPGWHTYWANPGDAGEATTIDWSLPQGFRAESIRWPTPSAIAIGPFTNYGFETEAVLLVDIVAPADAIPSGEASGTAALAAKVRWQVCKEVCIPEEAELSLPLPVVPAGSPVLPSADAPLIARAREAAPRPLPQGAVFSIRGDRIVLTAPGLAAAAGGAIASARFFPLHDGDIVNSAPQTLALGGGALTLSLTPGDNKPPSLGRLEGALVLEGAPADGRRAYAVEAGPEPQPSAAAEDAAAPPGPGQEPRSAASGEAPKGSGPDAASPARGSEPGLGFWMAMAFAALGGLILNLMPCVFPVLALKAASFATPGGHGPHSHAAHGAAYLAGVLASFAVLAAALIGLRATGAALGWGFQFQSPSFVLSMATLFLALGLSLSGVFSLGAGFAGAGDDLARRQGVAGFFFTGVLATLAATPCTAPFMGAAVGYALAQPALAAFAILMALGFGFAAPMTLVSVIPPLRRLMPRPGVWMETLKEALAFLLYASSAWMVWVLSIQQGSDGVMAAGVALTGTAFAAWLLGRSQRSGRPLFRLVPPVTAAAALAFSLTLLPGAAPHASAESEPGAPQRFSLARLDALRAGGEPVFVNLTAAWCITCKVNERMALKSERFIAALKERGVAYLKGDWTNGDPDVASLLDRFGRKGVPLYLLYPRGEGAPALLPQFLTESLVMQYIETIPPLKTIPAPPA